MSDEQRDEERILQLLGRSQPVSVPPFESLRSASVRSARRSVAVTLVTVLVAVAALYAGRALSNYRQQATPTAGVAAPTATATSSSSASPKVVLPQPIRQPITRTSPAAQVAWVSTYGDAGQSSVIGIDPSGKFVGMLGQGRYWRSADGSSLVGATDTAITVYSAADGVVERTFGRNPADAVADMAFTPDGRWLAFIGAGGYVQVVDLRTGLAQTMPLSRPTAPTNGSGSTLLFSADSKHLYTIVDWSSPRITAFDVTSTGLVQVASAVDGQGGQTLPGCAGPGLAPKVVGDGRTLVLYCHVDGSVGFVDLPTLTTIAIIHAEMKNPFWLAPIFTPDGQLLYLHQYPAFGDLMQVVDLRSRALLGPAPTPKKIEEPGLFSWLLPAAYAGGTPSTVPMSPDGLRLYAQASDGITVLRVPDLKPVAKLASGINVNEVWISGDGKTVYATDASRGLYVIPDGGGAPIVVKLPSLIGGFVASEHG
jgi:hypothetical protein